jgi:hypothetical protein
MANAGPVAWLCLAIARLWKARSNAIGVAGCLERTGLINGRRDSFVGFIATIRYTNWCGSVLAGEENARIRRRRWGISIVGDILTNAVLSVLTVARKVTKEKS